MILTYTGIDHIHDMVHNHGDIIFVQTVIFIRLHRDIDTKCHHVPKRVEDSEIPFIKDEEVRQPPTEKHKSIYFLPWSVSWTD